MAYPFQPYVLILYIPQSEYLRCKQRIFSYCFTVFYQQIYLFYMKVVVNILHNFTKLNTYTSATREIRNYIFNCIANYVAIHDGDKTAH